MGPYTICTADVLLKGDDEAADNIIAGRNTEWLNRFGSYREHRSSALPDIRSTRRSESDWRRSSAAPLGGGSFFGNQSDIQKQWSDQEVARTRNPLSDLKGQSTNCAFQTSQPPRPATKNDSAYPNQGAKLSETGSAKHRLQLFIGIFLQVQPGCRVVEVS